MKINKSFSLKYAVKAKKQEMPDFDELEVNMNAGVAFMDFCMFILSRAFGVCRWKCLASRKVLRDFISPSFEAFVILCYEKQ